MVEPYAEQDPENGRKTRFGIRTGAGAAGRAASAGARSRTKDIGRDDHPDGRVHAGRRERPDGGPRTGER